jgi:hypothetical protein
VSTCADTVKTGPCPTTGAPVAALIPELWPQSSRRGCVVRLAKGQAAYGAPLRCATDAAGRAWATNEARQEALDGAVYCLAADQPLLAWAFAILAWFLRPAR